MKRPAFSRLGTRPAIRPLPPHTVAVVPPFVPYGAAELKRSMGPNLLKGMAVAAVVFGVGLGTFAAVRADTAPVPLPPLIGWSDPWPDPAPPPLDPPAPERAAPPKASPDAPRVGTVTPVPDARADTLARVAENRALSAAPPADEGVEGGQGGTPGGAVGVPEPIPVPEPVVPEPVVEPPAPAAEPAPTPEARPAMNAFVPHEVAPTVARQVESLYPDILRRAGVEGRVVVRVLIGTDGRAEDVVVIRSDNEGFDRATVDAVRAWTFTPALQAGRPVRVWMTVPVRFRQR